MTGLRHAHISSLISGQNLGQIYASNHFHGRPLYGEPIRSSYFVTL